MRVWSLALLGGLLVTSVAPAQAPVWRFRWQAGQTLNYKTAQHLTDVIEEGEGKKTESQVKLDLHKRWQVLAVDAQGVATVQMSLVSLRQEMTKPDGEVLVFDSANPDQSDASLKEQMSKYIGPPLAVLRINAVGQVVEVKESKFGPASRFEVEPPFAIVLPAVAPAAGQAWERNYAITVDPPYGTGEKYQAVQKYLCKGFTSPGTALLGLATELKTKPDAAADMLPLLRELPTGEVLFDVQAGRMTKARLVVEKEVPEFQGKGTRFQFKSVSTIEYIGDK